MNRVLTVLFVASVLAYLPLIPVSAQESQEQAKTTAADAKGAKQARWEGVITRSSKDNSTLTVRQRGSDVEKTVVYDSSTKWTSQEHGSKKITPIDASQVNDNDRVICLGTWDKNGALHASLISKRVTP